MLFTNSNQILLDNIHTLKVSPFKNLYMPIVSESSFGDKKIGENMHLLL